MKLLYASVMAWNLCFVSGFPMLRSGWYTRAKRLYWDLIIESFACVGNPNREYMLRSFQWSGCSRCTFGTMVEKTTGPTIVLGVLYSVWTRNIGWLRTRAAAFWSRSSCSFSASSTFMPRKFFELWLQKLPFEGWKTNLFSGEVSVLNWNEFGNVLVLPSSFSGKTNWLLQFG